MLYKLLGNFTLAEKFHIGKYQTKQSDTKTNTAYKWDFNVAKQQNSVKILSLNMYNIIIPSILSSD